MQKRIDLLLLVIVPLFPAICWPCSFSLRSPQYPQDGDVNVPTNLLIEGSQACQNLHLEGGSFVPLEVVENLPFFVLSAQRPTELLEPNTTYQIECDSENIAFSTGDGPDETPPEIIVGARGKTAAEFPMDTSFGDSCGDSRPKATVEFPNLNDGNTPIQQLRIAEYYGDNEYNSLKEFFFEDGVATALLLQEDWKTRVSLIDGAGNIGPVTTIQIDWDGGCDCSSTASGSTWVALFLLGFCCLTRRYSGTADGAIIRQDFTRGTRVRRVDRSGDYQHEAPGAPQVDAAVR